MLKNDKSNSSIDLSVMKLIFNFLYKTSYKIIVICLTSLKKLKFIAIINSIFFRKNVKKSDKSLKLLIYYALVY